MKGVEGTPCSTFGVVPKDRSPLLRSLRRVAGSALMGAGAAIAILFAVGIFFSWGLSGWGEGAKAGFRDDLRRDLPIALSGVAAVLVGRRLRR